jgi:hypothetical protein
MFRVDNTIHFIGLGGTLRYPSTLAAQAALVYMRRVRDYASDHVVKSTGAVVWPTNLNVVQASWPDRDGKI